MTEIKGFISWNATVWCADGCPAWVQLGAEFQTTSSLEA
jgi:hypothetical protein